MSITTALGNALSGLTVTARAGEVVSSNIANVLTEGYARREIELSSLSLGGTGTGVRAVGIERVVNEVALADRRIATADRGDADLRAAFLKRIEDAVGSTGDAGSIGSRIAALEAALIGASARPDSSTRLAQALRAASDLARTINAASDTVQAARTDADAAIASDVGRLNDTLARIDELNTEITAWRAAGRDASALFDRRQALTDEVAHILPIRVVERPHDQIAMFSTGGATLVDGRASVFGFTPTDPIAAGMSLSGGPLSGLTLNGQPVGTAAGGLLGPGALTANFALRDGLGPAAQTELDALARDLYERFATSAVDPTLASGAPGLFTDAGAAFLAANEEGLAGRLELNAAADPARGGAVWRLRDGLAAAAPGPVGDATILTALRDALAAERTVSSGSMTGTEKNLSGLAAGVLSDLSAGRLDAEADAAFSASRVSALTGLILADGVDSDAEMQKLLLIERAYSANAQVMRTMDELIRQLMGILR
ncbi:MAG: flagellar hook-associated protein FlgK [Paracoccaceae bacterium]